MQQLIKNEDDADNTVTWNRKTDTKTTGKQLPAKRKHLHKEDFVIATEFRVISNQMTARACNLPKLYKPD